MTTAISRPSQAIHRQRADDPYRYITRCRKKWKTRPYRDGQRYYLGLFQSARDAMKARDAFFAGRLQPIPKFTRRTKSGAIIVEIYLGGERYSLPCTPDTAATVAFEHLRDILGEEAAMEAMQRK